MPYWLEQAYPREHPIYPFLDPQSGGQGRKKEKKEKDRQTNRKRRKTKRQNER